MKRLFKEVFRSLSKNKVTLVCLTILIFLTTFLFTLLNDVRTSYSRTINAYDKVSVLHNLTVDLDINPSGIIPNNGYDQIGSNNVDKVNEPIKFKASPNQTNSNIEKPVSYAINLPSDKQNFIKISDIGSWNPGNDKYKDKFISTQDFLSLYYESLGSKVTSTKFAINNPTNTNETKINEFSFEGNDSNSKKFKVYSQKDKKFELLKSKLELNKSDEITFEDEDKDVTLGDILTISSAARGAYNNQVKKDAAIDASPLFINLKTKKASFKTSFYDRWKDEGSLYIISSNDVLKLLGFEKETSNTDGFPRWIFKSNTKADLKIESMKTNENSIDKSDKLPKKFKLKNFIETNNNKPVSINQPEYVEMKPGRYTIPLNWIRKSEKLVTYNWHRFVLNWNEAIDENHSNWKGSYYKFITNFKNNYKNDYKDRLYFSYWDKTVTQRYTILGEKGKIKTQEITKNENITKDDLNVTFETPWQGAATNKKPNPKIPSNKARIDKRLDAWTIKDIEFNKIGNEVVTDEEFAKISNTENLKNYQDFIRNNTQSFAKISILKNIKEKVGEENLGIRKSITVETVNEETSKKNVFHFVDTGDKDRKISGFENNVGKLYNETLNPSLLHRSISNKNVDSFLIKPEKNSNVIKKIPSVYTRSLILTIFKNFTPDINYFNADIRFENYYDYHRNTKIPSIRNGKILILTTADDESKENGSSVIGAIAMPLPDKYIILQESKIDGFSNNRVWNKLLVQNKDYLSLDEVYNYIVKNNYTVRGQIGQNGWAIVSNQFKNSISLPISFGAISSELTQEIVQKNTIRGLIEQLQNVVLETSFSKLFRKQDLIRVFRAVADSIEANGFHTLLSISKTNKFILQKTILDVIKFLIKPIDQKNNVNLQYVNVNANSFIHNLINNVFKYFKNQYLANKDKGEYLIEEFTKLTKILGLKNVYIIPQLRITLADLFSYIKNKEQIFDVLSSLISSIDFVKFSSLINDWFDKNPYKPFTSVTDEYWTLSNDRIIISLLASINENKFKNALKELIDLVDFSKLLKPDEKQKSSYYAKWLAAHNEAKTDLSEQTKKDVETFFKALDAKKDNSYSNINEGLKSIISNISIEKFTNSLEKLIRKVRFPITANNRIYNNYNTEELNKYDYLAAFMNSLNSSIDNDISFNKIKQIQNAIIKILNLSNKTTKPVGDSLNIAIPAKEEGKISLLDLGVISKLGFPSITKGNNNLSFNLSINGFNLVDIKKIMSKVESAITTKSLLKLSQSEYNFLKNEALIKEIELNNLDSIKKKLDAYYAFISKVQLSNLKPNNNEFNFESKDNNQKIETYGDLAYWSAMINNNSKIENIEIIKKIHSLLAKNVISPLFINNDQYSIIKNQFASYALWIKLGYLLNQIGDVEEKIIIDDITGNKIIEKQHKKVLSFAQIKAILNELYSFAKKDEVIKAMQNFDKVVNPIPSFAFLGSDSNQNSTIFKIPYAHAHTNLANRELEKLLENSEAIKTFKANLSNNAGIKDVKIIEKIINLLKKNSYELTYNLGYIATASQNATNYENALKTFIDSFLKTDNNKNNKLAPLINNDYEFDLAFKIATQKTKLSNHLSLLNIPNNLLNPLTLLSFPQIPLYYGLSPNPDEGNIAYIVRKILDNLRLSKIDDIKKQVESLTQNYQDRTFLVQSRNDDDVDLDIASLNNIFNNVLVDKNGNELKLFGINITSSIKKALFNIVKPISVNNLISYTDSGSYLAKVNYGYASKNNKEAYTGDITKYLSNPYEMQLFIASLDDKYKIKVNTQEYLIIGIDSTTDYLYPVINEENIQVDTKTQAVVYVNSKGFDRIFSAYPTFAIKEYALVKAPIDKKGRFLENNTPEQIKLDLIKKINLINPNSANKVFLRDELDSINPERKIRIVTIRSIINSIKNVNIYLITILIALVAFIIYFIMKRYIEARNKVVGILRAQGYKTSKIALAFCAFGWIPVVVGSFFGYIVGTMLQKGAMSVLASYWTLENNTIPINILTMLVTILIPFLFVSGLIFIITSISVSKKPIELMSGVIEINVGNFAQRVSAMFRKLPVKIRFIASMLLNNFWKMFSLFLAFSTTSLISMFFLSSNNIFNKAITRTYEDRLYKFKLDLESPTTEGGPYVTYSKDNINSLLYVPNDLAGNSSSNGSQLDYANPNFLRPGHSFNTDVIQKKYEPTVLTKSSLDILLGLSVELSPWDITYANMPETQRARVAQIFKRVSREMQNTQNLIDISKVKTNENYLDVSNSAFENIIAVTDLNKFKKDLAEGKEEDLSNRTNYFLFTSSGNEKSGNEKINEKFKFVEWNKTEKFYQKPKLVSTSRYRQEYRNFLINAYRKIQNLDFFVSFGGVYWNDTTNEKYTYAKALLNNKEIKVYGYYDDSKFISIRNSKNQDLQKKLSEYKYDETKNIPIIVNSVVEKKYGLKIGSKFQLNLLNHVDRFSHKALLQKAPRTKYNFVVIGISETYINEEFVTSKKILDKILGYDTLSKRLKDARKLELDNAIFQNPKKKEEIIKAFDKKYDAFNGILSNDKTPVQTIDTLTTYSSTGFWGAASSFEVEEASDQSVWEFFKHIFISNKNLNYTSVYEHNINAYNEAYPEAKLDYKKTLFKLLNIDEAAFNKIVVTQNSNEEFKTLARNTLTKFYGSHPETIYGKNIMYGASFDVNSKDIEAGFISGISKTVNIILILFIFMSLLISIIILIVITNIMIASNQRSIATFSVLGYTNREKILLFFANFIPTILFACLLMIPVTLLLITVFNAFMMATSQIVLPFVLNYSTIIISAAICLTVFAITSMLTWRSLNKIKAVDALKGK